MLVQCVWVSWSDLFYIVCIKKTVAFTISAQRANRKIKNPSQNCRKIVCTGCIIYVKFTLLKNVYLCKIFDAWNNVWTENLKNFKESTERGWIIIASRYNKVCSMHSHIQRKQKKMSFAIAWIYNIVAKVCMLLKRTWLKCSNFYEWMIYLKIIGIC